MYWMTTGKKPVESAAPQTVALFRAAIQGSEKSDAAQSQTKLQTDRSAVAAADQAASLPGTPISQPSSAQRRNLLCTIMFLDLVGYSLRSVDDQVALKKLFNELLAKALKGVPEDTASPSTPATARPSASWATRRRRCTPPCCCATCWASATEPCCRCASACTWGRCAWFRTSTTASTSSGDGINVAQRVMDFAQGNQVLVSRSYYDVISRITDDTADLFQYLGQYEDKHGRLHEVYAVATQRRRRHYAARRARPPATRTRCRSRAARRS